MSSAKSRRHAPPWDRDHSVNDPNPSEFQGKDTMSRVHGYLIVLLLSIGLVVPGAFAQSEMTLQTIKGDLLSIKGDRYVVKDFSGRLVYLEVDKNTKRERMLVPGERLEADVIIGERVVALRSANESMMKGAVR